MSLIVQKFGCSSVRDAQRIQNVARIIAETYVKGNDVIVVLSAQGDTTDDLIAKAQEINANPSKREMDMLLSTGEQISVSLCAMALEAMGLPCVSLAAWQVGIQSTAVHTDARIKRIDSERIQSELDQHRIVLVTGFQGVDRNGDVTTLGRGGSDTSAVALAAAFGAGVFVVRALVSSVSITRSSWQDSSRFYSAIDDRRQDLVEGIELSQTLEELEKQIAEGAANPLAYADAEALREEIADLEDLVNSPERVREGITGELDEDTVMMDALEAGAADFEADGPAMEITCDPDAFNDVVKALEEKGYSFVSAEVEMVPQNYITLS